MCGPTQPYDPYHATEFALTNPYPFTSADLETFDAQRYHNDPAFSDYASLGFTTEASSRSAFDDPPWSSISTRGALSSVIVPLLDDTLCESPGAICYNRGLDGALEDLDFSPSMLESSLNAHPDEWTTERISDRPFYHTDSGLDIGSVTAPSVFFYESMVSMDPTEPTTSMTPPRSVVSIVRAANSKRKQQEPLSHGSWAENLSLHDFSEPRKHRRIDPAQPSKANTQDTGKLYRCKLCNRHLTLLKDLKRHELSKHTDRPKWFCPVWSCPFAAVGFKRKDKAFQHMRTHKRESDAGLEPRLNMEDEESKSDLLNEAL